jgi:hypothetical protein
MNRQNAVLRKPLPARTEFGFALNWEEERVKKRKELRVKKVERGNGGGETKLNKKLACGKTGMV